MYDQTGTCSDQSCAVTLGSQRAVPGPGLLLLVNGKSSLLRSRGLKQSTTSAAHHSVALNHPPDCSESYSGDKNVSYKERV